MFIDFSVTYQKVGTARAFLAAQRKTGTTYGFEQFTAWVKASRQPILAAEAGYFLTEFHFNGVSISTKQIDSSNSPIINYAPIGITSRLTLSREGLLETSHYRMTGPETAEANAFLRNASLAELELRHRFLEPLLYHLVPEFSRPDIEWAEMEQNEYAVIHSEIIEVLRRLSIEQNDTVLDIACGEGQLAVKIIRELGAAVHGLDIAENNINKSDFNARSAQIPRNKLVIMQAPAQDILPNRKYRFIVLSGLLNHYVVLTPNDALAIIKNIAKNCLEQNGYLIVSGHTPGIFCSKEFKAMGFNVVQSINPLRNRGLYVLQYKGSFHPLEEEISYFKEMGMRKTRMIEYGEKLFQEMRRLTGDWINFINGNGRINHNQVKHLHARLLRTTNQPLNDYFDNPIVSYFFTITSALTEQELAEHLPGWTREMIFHYFIMQQVEAEHR